MTGWRIAPTDAAGIKDHRHEYSRRAGLPARRFLFFSLVFLFDKFRQSKYANWQSGSLTGVKMLKITPKNRRSAIDISGRLYRLPSLLLKPQRIFHLVLTYRE
nr:hypothetical protein [Cronobacter muytjensii]